MKIEQILEDPCRKHPDVPMPCCLCHGAELAERDRGRGKKPPSIPPWNDRSVLPAERRTAERAAMGLIKDTVSGWGRAKQLRAHGDEGR